MTENQKNNSPKIYPDDPFEGGQDLPLDEVKEIYRHTRQKCQEWFEKAIALEEENRELRKELAGLRNNI